MGTRLPLRRRRPEDWPLSVEIVSHPFAPANAAPISLSLRSPAWVDAVPIRTATNGYSGDNTAEVGAIGVHGEEVEALVRTEATADENDLLPVG